MKAWILHGIGDLRLEDVTEPVIAEDEVLVKVNAAGICGSDLPRIYRTGAYHHPLIPGHEFSGTVVETGAEVDARWRGTRVGVFPLIPCGTCGPCLKKRYEMCRRYSYLGSRRDGGFAEYTAVPARNLIALPDEVSYEAAAMLEPMAVAVHAMRRVNPAETDTAAVCGLGTIGLLLALFLRDAGVRNLFVIGNKEFQKQTVLKMGLDESAYCDARRQDTGKWLAERTNGSGADVFFECVGKNETLLQAIEDTSPAGRVCLIGNPYSDMLMEKTIYWKILRNQLTVTGTWNSSFAHDARDDWHYVLDRLSDRRIAPERLITHRLAFEEMEQGLHMMRDKTEDYVKVILKNF